ncbi:UDP-N-acetylmuramoyl-L-alanyl-D-glutamate--2,6-diaminopimelate ligase [Hymenobacter ginsengisoli]|uniref:UDP-N-acetylmuramoyl-L-alanyl-D-glutamate--2,6-diaminopimelate ligase n=1 Tax=Hymenobacter ginsengisoli TaxID=1051626 RepID=A0ABP8PZL9_9BACT|nr:MULTISPECIES: UDP-N-acetylmuramoyl-L-alanyl-D-glutamate--2,6-diaminopimelate ligase [unclassified Hymenobacter]MBO2030442.1 UDP-N-acetylmuramoyl-L-alanyl-D-glutamate--2,6-diaminopimelate ligase [Hymenobacter sp. BT559]
MSTLPLFALLTDVTVLAQHGAADMPVAGLTLDSRQAGPGMLFCALRGTATDGHKFIDKAVGQGAAVIVCEELPAELNPATTYVQVADTAAALGPIASAFYGHPSRQLQLVGVTGTNGKTTCATVLHKLLRELGYHAGLLSTVQNQIDETVIPSTHTTPDAIRLNELLARMVAAGCTHACMEVSSHAVAQGRIGGLRFVGGLFTNLTHDHLDYHGTFDNYLKAKKGFFDALPKAAFALTNADDKRGPVMLQNTAARRATYSLRSAADFRARLVDNSLAGLLLEIDNREVHFRLIGVFNAYNLLAVYGAAVLLGEDPTEVLTILSGLTTAPGRFEPVTVPGQGVSGLVDYAHTPDALENVLQTLLQTRRPDQRIITVVGCGGNRDATKRPIMARLAAQLSDEVILTSDNPRDEDPLAILDQMQAGLTPPADAHTQTIADRRQAIRAAVALARPGDLVLVAGKGHETYQEIKGVKTHFDDKEELRAALTEIKNAEL